MKLYMVTPERIRWEKIADNPDGEMSEKTGYYPIRERKQKGEERGGELVDAIRRTIFLITSTLKK